MVIKGLLNGDLYLNIAKKIKTIKLLREVKKDKPFSTDLFF